MIRVRVVCEVVVKDMMYAVVIGVESSSLR